MKRIWCFLTICCMAACMTGCYWNATVQSDEVGLMMGDGVQITDVVGAGRYTDLGWYAELQTMDTSVKQVALTISDVSTSDKQTISVQVLAEVSRKNDADSVRNLWANYNSVARSDDQMIKLVQDLLRSPVNKISTQMTVDEMLGVDETSDKTRTTMEQDISTLLTPILEARGLKLHTFNVTNITVDPQYQEKLQEKSIAAIEIELAEQKAQQLAKQLEQEQAQTEIDLEKARRANLVAEEEAKVYAQSPEAYELKRLELLRGLLGDSDKVYFIPEGTDITLFLGGDTTSTPVPVE